jgi:hypothetical protein
MLLDLLNPDDRTLQNNRPAPDMTSKSETFMDAAQRNASTIPEDLNIGLAPQSWPIYPTATQPFTDGASNNVRTARRTCRTCPANNTGIKTSVAAGLVNIADYRPLQPGLLKLIQQID